VRRSPVVSQPLARFSMTVAPKTSPTWPGSSLKPVPNGRQSGQGPVVEQCPVHPRLWPGSTASSTPNDVQLGQVHPNTNAHVKGNLARSTVHTCPQGTLALARVIISTSSILSTPWPGSKAYRNAHPSYALAKVISTTLPHSPITLARVCSMTPPTEGTPWPESLSLQHPLRFHFGQGLLHVSIH